MSDGNPDCYLSNEDADAALITAGIVKPEDFEGSSDELILSDPGVEVEASGAAIPDCARGWLCLFEHANGGGRRLIFQDEYWQDLDDYGFANTVSSWRNRQSDGGAMLRDWQSDSTLDLSGNAYASNMGWWSDKADEVHP